MQPPAYPEDLFRLVAARRGHFEMESGYHSEAWYDLDRLWDDARRLRPFVRALAQLIAAHRPEGICGPMTGGARLAAGISEELGLPHFHTERLAPSASPGLFTVRYQLPLAAHAHVMHRRLAIVDDAISAGSAVRGTHADLLRHGAIPVALGALIVFGDRAEEFARAEALPLESVARTAFGLWKPEECPLCQAGWAVERVSDGPLPAAGL